MKSSMTLAIATAIASMTLSTPADAQRHHRWNNHNRWNNQWRTIGYTRVNGRDTDTIRVPGTARYRQMRVCVFYGPIHMRDLDVRFRNGGRQDISVRNLMRPGTCTRNLDLRGNRRDVTAVRLKYTPLARGWIRPVVRVQVR